MLEIPRFPNTNFTMMTQDSAPHHLATPNSPRNLNPTAPAFHQNQIALSPNYNNQSVTMYNHSPRGDKNLSDAIFAGTEAVRQGLLNNGDVAGAGYLLPGSVPGAQSQLLHQLANHNLQNPMSLPPTVMPHAMLVSSAANSHQPVISSPVTSQHQAAAATYALATLDVGGHQQLHKHMRSSNQNSPHMSNGEMLHNGTLAMEEEALKTLNTGGVQSVGAGADKDYPEEMLAPIRKQMQFYFSNENLPGDKFLNQHMDLDKYIPLELFLDFGRIKPICNSIDLLTKAVETISVLELSEDRKKVRVSQCRKTLTLRGFPQSTTEDDVRQFILEMGADVPTHIEFVMFKENYSVWYVSFRDESAALNSFFQFHQKAVYKGHTIGCCIKSSGTLAAAGYFPSMEDSSQRRLAYQNQVAAVGTAPVHAVQNPISQPQPQQPQPLIQPFNTMQLHSYLSGSPANIYYQQTPQGSFLPYMAGMIHSWPAPGAAMEPGLIMQNNGLQPQHIRTSMPRAHLMPTGSAPQHRFNRPQRVRQSNPDRTNERPSVMSLPGPPPTSPHASDNSMAASVVSQEAYMSRRAAVQEDMIPQTQVVSHKFAAPVATQHQAHTVATAVATQHQPHTVTTAASTSLVNPSGLEPLPVSHYQHHHQHSVMVQTTVPATTCAPPPPTPHITSNPPPNTQLLHHQHIQPPPPIPQQQQQHHHHHQQPPPQTVHHHQHQQQQQHYQQQTNHTVQHSNQLPPQPQHHQTAHAQPGHHHQPQHMYQQHMSHQQHHHYHNSQQHHHQYLPPQSHQQSPPGSRSDKRSRRKRDENMRNQRLERSQSNRAHFSSQSLAAVDNFTMEANSFPPLPGTLSSLSNSEVSHESRMADIVRGISRNSLSNSNVHRASPSTPSPVATPPAPLTSGGVGVQHQGLSQSSLVDVHSLDDEDVTSSSQDDVETDASTFETKVIRSELHSLSSMAEPAVLPLQSRPQKVSTPMMSSAALQAPRQTDRQIDNRQSWLQVQGKTSQQPVYSLQQLSVVVGTAVCTNETPKLSYAQILAHKNREAASNPGNGEASTPAGLLSNSASSAEPNLTHPCTSNTSNLRHSPQSANAFREHGNYQGGQQYRSSQRGSSKDGMPRSDAPAPARQPNGGRRNSKENRLNNKFDRRKPDLRQK